MWTNRRLPGLWIGGLLFLSQWVGGCSSEPDAPTSPAEPRRPLSGSQTIQVPEEEILGTVFEGTGQRTTRTDLFVRLRAVGNGACIFTAGERPSDPVTQCTRTLDMMPVLPGGSTVKSGVTIQWGWFNDLDTDNNPCNPDQLATGTLETEVHDLDGEGDADETGPERHCVTTGRYEVELVSGPQLSLSQGSVVRRRTIDHVETTQGFFFNNRSLEQAGTGQATDTFVHFRLGFPLAVQMNWLKIDNPDTGEKFAEGDTIVQVNVPVGFLSEARTSALGSTTSPLLFRVRFNTGVPLDRSEYANPDRLIRTHPYPDPGTFTTLVEVARPADATGETGKLSGIRKVVVQEIAPVATVEVSPSSATITSIDDTVTLTATLRDASDNILTGRAVEWTSSDPVVATVVGNGNMATVTSHANGSATITATSEGVSGSATVTVAVDPFANFEDCVLFVETGPKAILPDGTIEIELKARFECPESDQGNAVEHRWTFGDGVDTPWMTGITELFHEYSGPASYTAKIEAREINHPSVYDSAEYPVEVSDAPVASVTVTPGTVTIEEGETTTLLATLQDGQGNTLSGREVSWTKSNSKVSLSSSGNQVDVTGVAEGSVTVTASSEGISGSSSITVEGSPPPINDSSAGTNSFPAAMAQWQFYAVSVRMENTGGLTWKGSTGYALERISGIDFTPVSVGMGGSTTNPGSIKTFTFNLWNDGNVGQTYDVRYRMHQNGTAFGQSSGRNIEILDPDTCTKNCGPSVSMAPTGSAAPVGAYAPRLGAASSAGEVIQTLVVDDYPLHFVQEQGQDVAYIRYFAALAEDWPVDVVFDLTFDTQSVNLGQSRKGLQAPGYEVEIEQEDAGRVKIKLKRVDMDAALTGEGLLLEIPIVAKPDQPLLTSLDEVILTVTQ